MPEHTCHRPGCNRNIPPRMFACTADWYFLPKSLRDAIWAAYRPGQEITKDPSQKYLDAARAAINYYESH